MKIKRICYFLRLVLDFVKIGVFEEFKMSDFSIPWVPSYLGINAKNIKAKLKVNIAETRQSLPNHYLLFAIWRTFKFHILFCLGIRILDRCFLMSEVSISIAYFSTLPHVFYLSAIERILLGLLVKQIRTCSAVECHSWVFLAFVIVASSRTVLHRTFFYLNKGICLKIQTGLLSLLFSKVLSIKLYTLNQIRAGDLINLVSKSEIDLERNEHILSVITGPFQLVSLFYVLWLQFGPSSGIGIAILITVALSQSYSRKVSTAHRRNIWSTSAGRARLMTQLFFGIKTIKVYVMEDIISNLVEKARNKETDALKMSHGLERLWYVASMSCPLIAMILTVLLHEVLGNEKSLEQVIVASTVFYHLRVLLFNNMRLGTKQLGNFINTMSKFQEILNAEEFVPLSGNLGDGMLRIERLTLTTDQLGSASNPSKLITELDLLVEKQELVVITGNTGVGKSLLLESILGEFPIEGRNIGVGGRISYAAQQPWIFKGTIRENILFYTKYNAQRYCQVLEACALDEDLNLFYDGDQTVLDESGTRLSGGQKARISLARALYREAELYLLDDILSNVDTKVGTHIFHSCINGFLRNKTRILVTSNATLLTGTGKHFCIQNGTLVQTSSNIPVRVLNEQAIRNEKKDEFASNIQSNQGNGGKQEHCHVVKRSQLRLCWEYLTIGAGYMYIFQYLFLTAILMALYHGTEYLLQQNFQTLSAKKLNLNQVQVLLALICLILVASVQYSTLVTIALKSGTELHNRMLQTILNAPIRVFSQPSSPGAILERFTTGMTVVDEVLPFKLHTVSQVFLMYLSGYTLVVYKLGLTIVFPLLFLFTFASFLQKWNIKCCQHLTNLSHLTKEPINSRLISAITGKTTIRGLKKTKNMEHDYDKCLNIHFWINYVRISLADFTTLLIELAAIGILNMLVVSAMFFPHLGIETAFSPLLSFGATIGYAFSQGVLLVTKGKQVERMLDLIKISKEADDFSNEETPNGWPWKGKITFSDVSVSYGPSSPVLKNLNFTIQPGEKIAIIGRTGCGKSTLVSALSRLVETSGDILLDGMNISKISLKSLRHNIVVIPQDPYLFDGTLRFCLDPFDQFNDKNIMKALNTVHLTALVDTLPGGLLTEIGEGGNIFSSGQRQLLSLARAILRKPKVLVMDEPTASVDGNTSNTILTEIMKNFPQSTVITVLHRLAFLHSYDRVMVIDRGEIVEFAQPRCLETKLLLVSGDHQATHSVIDQLKI